ncbi:MAG TPA: hypothetical protein VGM44_11260 [Polyangiaceae bacterium]
MREREAEPTKPAWLCGVALMLAALYVLFVDLDATPFDDSFFFKRIALNALHGAGFSWNPSDGPVYGLTSQLFGWLALPLTALFPQHFVVASKVLATLAFAAVVALTLRFAARAHVNRRDAGLLVLFALGTPLTLLTLHTGMETSVCLALIALALSATEPVLCAVLTLLVYSCRPDAALIPALAFIALERKNAGRAARYALVLGVLLALSLAGFRAYYGSALPLPFYAKTAGFSAFDGALRAAGLRDKLGHLTLFCAFAAPLAFIAWRGRSARVSALLVTSLAFISYQALLTNEIMGYRARFYLPALVPLTFAALLACARFRQRFTARSTVIASTVWLALLALAFALRPHAPLDRVPWSAGVLVLFLGVLLGDQLRQRSWLSPRAATAASLSCLLAGTVLLRPPRRDLAALDDGAFLRRASAEVTTTRGLFEIARCMPGSHTLYHSEIGIPGLVLPAWRIVDWVGLMSKELAQKRPPLDDYCLRDRPEVLFLPHKTYRALNAEIRASRCLNGYTLMVQDSSSPLYVRNDLSASFNACRRDPWRVK